MRLHLLVTYIILSISVTTTFSQSMDSLITAFDHQKGTPAVQTAKEIFRFLDEDGFTDGPVEIIPGSSADSVKALTWYWASEWYYDAQRYEDALSYAGKALDASHKRGLEEIACDCSNVLSIAYFRKSDYRRSLEYARQTLETARRLEDESRIAYSLNTLAGICLASKQSSEGIKYITEAILICEKQKDSLKLAVRCGMAAELYHSLGEDDKSLEYSRRAYDINKAMGLKDKAAIRLSQMAAAQIALGQFEDARASLLEALPELEKAGNLQSWAISCNQLGDISLKDRDTNNAIRYYRDALEVFRSKGDAYNMSHSHLGLSKALSSEDPATAMEHLTEYTHIKDSIYDSEMNSGLNEYNARYRNEQLSSERDFHLHGKRRILAGGIFATALLAVAVWLLLRKNKSAKEALEDLSRKLENAKKKPVSRAKLVGSDVTERFKEEIRRQIEGGRSIDLQEVADKLCTTRANLNRQIKSQTGGSSSALVSEVRIEIAKKILLSDSDTPISDVASACGIEDISYFISLFKKSTGLTPKQWRDTHTAA